MSTGKKKKISAGKRKFRRFLRIYASILGIATIVICIIVWGRLKNYQESYDNSKSKHSPDKFMDEFVDNLDYEKILGYVKNYGINVETGINPKENHAAYFAACVAADGAKYDKNDKYTSVMPVYDVYAGDTRIAVLSLKADGKSDSFGFHDWKIRDMAFDTNEIDYKTATVTVNKGMVLKYNGQAVGDEYKIDSTDNDAIRAKARALGASVPAVETYVIKDTFGSRNITATDSNGNSYTAFVEGNTYDFTGSKGTKAPEDIEKRVFDTIDSYILTIYNHKSFDETATYIEYDSDAYRLIKDVLASVIWGWTPYTVDILEQSVTDYVAYGDNLFSCSYYGKIYKYEEGKSESGEETFNYRLIFKKHDGKWYLNYFIIV